MQPALNHVDAMFWEEVERARAMNPEEKLLAGARLFDYACRITMDGIRNTYPGADDADVLRILGDRLVMAARLERLP